RTQPARPAARPLVATMMPVGVVLAKACIARMTPTHGEDLAIHFHARRQRLRLGIEPRASQVFGHVHQLAAGPIDAHPVVVVQRVVEQTDAIEDGATPESRGLADTT